MRNMKEQELGIHNMKGDSLAQKIPLLVSGELDFKDVFDKRNRFDLTYLASDGVLTELEHYFHNKENYEKLSEQDRVDFLKWACFTQIYAEELLQNKKTIESLTWWDTQHKTEWLEHIDAVQIIANLAKQSRLLYENELFDMLGYTMEQLVEPTLARLPVQKLYNDILNDTTRVNHYQAMIALLCIIQKLPNIPNTIEQANRILTKYGELDYIIAGQMVGVFNDERDYSHYFATSTIKYQYLNDYLHQGNIKTPHVQKQTQDEQSLYAKLDSYLDGKNKAPHYLFNINAISMLKNTSDIPETTMKHWLSAIIKNEIVESERSPAYKNHSIADFVKQYGKPILIDISDVLPFKIADFESLYHQLGVIERLKMVLKDVPHDLLSFNGWNGISMEKMIENDATRISYIDTTKQPSFSLSKQKFSTSHFMLMSYFPEIIDWIDESIFADIDTGKLVGFVNKLEQDCYYNSQAVQKLHDRLIYSDFIKQNLKRVTEPSARQKQGKLKV